MVAALALLGAAAPAVDGAERLRVTPTGAGWSARTARRSSTSATPPGCCSSELDDEETERYLTDRAAKGFTVIQAVVLWSEEGRDVPNAKGDPPLVDRTTLEPNEAYFRHVDAVVHRANELGLVFGMLPTWGSYWKQVGQERPPVLDTANARSYGRFLGERYRDADLIWILGGDQNIESEDERAVVDALAAGLQEGDGGAHLMTFHPRGPGLSSLRLHDAPWLDFNMIQSSHGARDHDNGIFVEHDYALSPAKPTVDGEPRYERIPVGFYFREHDRHVRFDAYDVRQAAYWSLLAGACGHTYGHNSVWQMFRPGGSPEIHADVPWWEALDHPGAFQMGFVRRLFESRPFTRLRPDAKMIVEGPSERGAKVRAARASDGSFAFVYSPRGEPFTVDKSAIDAPAGEGDLVRPALRGREPLPHHGQHGLSDLHPAHLRPGQRLDPGAGVGGGPLPAAGPAVTTDSGSWRETYDTPASDPARPGIRGVDQHTVAQPKLVALLDGDRAAGAGLHRFLAEGVRDDQAVVAAVIPARPEVGRIRHDRHADPLPLRAAAVVDPAGLPAPDRLRALAAF